MVVWESILLCIFFLFTAREICQLITYFKKKNSTTAIQPLNSTAEHNVEVVSVVRKDNNHLESPNKPILRIEKDKNLSNDDRDANGRHLREEGIEDSYAKEDGYRTISKENTIGHIDLDRDGVDDLEELERMLEEAIPDSNTMGSVLDWISIVIIVLLLSLRLRYVETAQELHTLFLGSAENHDYSDNMTDIIMKFDKLDKYTSMQHFLLMIVMFVAMSQFFRYVSFNSRLGIVANTMVDSAKDLLPVLFIFIIVLTGYSVLGCAVYGHDIESWSTVSGSMLNLMIFIVGEYGSYFDSKSIHKF